MTSELNQAKVDAFGQKLFEIINHSAIALMTSIGHRTGLFDVLSRLPGATSERIAAEADLNERYVREWLGAMATGGIVEYRLEDQTFRLPAEHAACLTRAASPNNLAASMQWIAVLGHVEENVVAAFRHGNGVPYSAYPRFHEVMAEESAQTVVAALQGHILPLVPGLKDRLAQGIDALDVGCGSGRAFNELATSFPKSRFTGFDASEEGIGFAKAEAARRGLANAQFMTQDVAEMSQREVFDLITAFDAIHDQPKPEKVLRNIATALKPNGTFLMQDISGSSHLHIDQKHPLGPFLYTVSCMHCMSVSLAAGGPGLGAMWGKEKALEMLKQAGFRNVRVESLPHDPINYYYIATTPVV